jgi:hypothetical protein
LLTALFFSLVVFSQSKEFVLIDFISKEPIDLAQISYPELARSISNKDGRIRIPLKEQSILVSHINYIEKVFSFDAFKKKDTLFLSPKTNQLDEIIISNVDLKAKISNILENTYLEKYSTKRAINKSTYKEVFRVNDSLSRLFQIQMDWWSKNALFKGNKPINKQNIINLKSVDYSKLEKIDASFVNGNGASVKNEDFFKFIHLNFLLEIFKNLSSDIVIKSFEKEKNSISVYFDATLIQNNRKIYDYKNSLIVFNADYTAINYLKLNMIYNSDWIEDISRKTKISYQRKTTYNSLELSYTKSKNKKLTLNYFIFEVQGLIKTNQIIDTVSSKQSLFISESILDKKIKKGNIDFYKPFYENLPTGLKTSNVKILLTKEEKEYLNQQN